MSGTTNTTDKNAGHPPGVTVLFGTLATTIITASLILALQGYFGQMRWAEERGKILDTRYRDTDLLLDAQRKELQSYDWISPGAGIVRVPLERGIQAYLDECAKAGR